MLELLVDKIVGGFQADTGRSELFRFGLDLTSGCRSTKRFDQSKSAAVPKLQSVDHFVFDSSVRKAGQTFRKHKNNAFYNLLFKLILDLKQNKVVTYCKQLVI
jgi:hypothetical protein